MRKEKNVPNVTPANLSLNLLPPMAISIPGANIAQLAIMSESKKTFKIFF
jgi:hypothetical protein